MNPDGFKNVETKEKPKFLYHGTTVQNIDELEPREDITPQGEKMGKCIYTTPNPAFAAAQSFWWVTSEGVKLFTRDGQVVLKVPEALQGRLHQPVSIYTLSSESFEKTDRDTMKLTYISRIPVKPDNEQKFASVIEAVEHFGGIVEIIPAS